MAFWNRNTTPDHAPVTTAQMAAQFGGGGPARTVSIVKDTNGAPAVDLTKVRMAGHVDLAKKADKAGISLSKRGLSGIRAQALLYIDHSVSMEWSGREYFTNGTVQAIVERALGFALQVDVDGVIPVHAFDNRLWPEVKVGLEEDPGNEVHDYRGIVNRKIWHRAEMGGTKYAVVLNDVKRQAMETDAPLLVIIVTDGEPNDDDVATRLIRELAGYPVFIKFLAVEEVQYLDDLDNLTNRLVDNVDAKFFNGQRDPDTGVVWPRIQEITDLQFADAMADEWDKWFTAATNAGILR